VEVDCQQVSFANSRVHVAGFFARPAEPGNYRGVLVVPENLGLTEHRQAETAAMAERGYAVLAVNLFSRMGGRPPAGPFADDAERRRSNFLAMPDEQAVGDITTAARWLRAQPSVSGVALLGFCSGGSQAFVAACTHPGMFDCVVSIYGNIVLPGELTRDYQPISRLRHVRGLDCPMQGHYGERDHVVPPEDVDALEQELHRYNRVAEIHRYPGAGHVFADPRHPNYNQEATELLWSRVYPFLEQRVPVASVPSEGTAA
jgi:carboxymethylenebutenolidase